MNTSSLLDQLLKSGLSLGQNKQVSGNERSSTGGALGDLLKGGGGGLGSLLGGAGKGALATGALGMLLGSKRRGHSSAGMSSVQRSGLVALGLLAYKAYSNWQAQQANAPKAEPQTIDRLPAEKAEGHSQAILKALVAAAKADGHVDDNERRLLEAELGKATDDPGLQQWLQTELNKPLDPAEVARAASSPEIAAEMYLASLMAVNEAQFMERAYLDELARELRLDPALKAELEAQAKAA
ncbi:tellurite resistance TerB family protein [Azomonas macrocytogenes]|uniref:Uncharacterized membrane protein YebE (DUF533 family) n=1 Tax=Azomonas macrocytogenes TaxID=69962 RepID=A0A839SY06_AZOMA|nr:tellurite resistance TerB family protein [Azomonas macrocytogenes]MBB3101992.1 uncharacterized membrane protein YebE (DUF533 family) [Azomonas macrocytogenes]